MLIDSWISVVDYTSGERPKLLNIERLNQQQGSEARWP